MVNPTGGGIRVDGRGDGRFWSRRLHWRVKNGVGQWVTEHHLGCDFLLPWGPGQDVYSPIEGKIFRHGTCYQNCDDYHLIVIRNNGWEWRLLYCTPTIEPREWVKAGDVIARAENVALRYPKNNQGEMLPHVHGEVRERNSEGYKVLRDPWELCHAA